MAPPNVDVITLENFREKMPRWNPSQGNHLYALVDMGSNGIRFSVSDLSPPTTRLLRCLYRERAAISLFDALNSSGSSSAAAPTSQPSPSSPLQQPMVFPPETIALTARTLARFRRVALDDFGVPPAHFIVFATEAMRRADNAATMLDAIAAAAAVAGEPEADKMRVRILAPAVETLFGSVGARSAFVDVKGLFLDLGGGSVQMSYADTYAARKSDRGGGSGGDDSVGYEVTAAQAGESLPFGAARLIRVLDGADVAAQGDARTSLAAGMRQAFEALRAKFPSLAATTAAATAGAAAEEDRNKAEWVDGASMSSASWSNSAGIDIYLCGGGFRGYGSMLMHTDPWQPYPIPSVAGYTVSGAHFRDTKKMLRVNSEFKGKIFGMSGRRRRQFPAIVTVVEALVAAVPPIRSVTFCGGGNREGALMMMLPREVRETNPLSLLLHGSGSPVTAAEERIISSVADCLFGALPSPVQEEATTIFSHDLALEFVRQIWARAGEDGDANAAHALHDAVTREPSCPGLTHQARAVLGLTTCARWGGSLGPADMTLRDNLRRLVEARDPLASFWAEYIGVAAAVLATVTPSRPRSVEAIAGMIRFEASMEQGKKKQKVALKISIAPRRASGIDLGNLAGQFKDLHVRDKHDDVKVVVSFADLS